MKTIVTFMFLLLTLNLSAGPPYDTDDPEPVAFHHWEVYFSTHLSYTLTQFAGTAPHFEINYGVVPNVQLHLIAPVNFVANFNERTNYGYGDTEFGIKFRFVQESNWCPQIGIFPIIELPSGNPDKELGSGNVQVYLPIWIQKSFGKWTTYGGGGYWINPGTGNRNWQFFGWQVQYHILKQLSLGTELYHATASTVDGQSETRFNIGAIIDFSEHSHLLFSVGGSINGSVQEQCYLGYQMTL